MKFAVGIVLYFPNKKEIEGVNQWSSLGIFDCCLVYDNSVETHKSKLNSDIVYYYNGKNDGLSVAYNSFIQYCVEKKVDYLCIMDQDSVYDIKELNSMQNFLKKNYGIVKKYPLIAPRSYCATSVLIKREEKLTSTNYAINSGSFLCITNLVQNSLRYDEGIFCDGVDYEFSLQIRAKGLEVMIYENSVLWQNLGYIRKVFGRKYCCHTPIRYYYIIKARKYINNKYHGKSSAFFYNFIQFIGTIGKIIVFEDEKILKIKMALAGYKTK